MANPFKAIGRGIARGAKALVGKGGKGGGASAAAMNNKLGAAAPTMGGPQRASLQSPASPLPNVRRTGGAAGTFTSAKAAVTANAPNVGAGGGGRARSSRPAPVRTVPPTPPAGAGLAPSVQPKSRPVASAHEASYFKGQRMGPTAAPASPARTAAPASPARTAAPASPARKPLTAMDMTRDRAAQQRARAQRDSRRSAARSR